MLFSEQPVISNDKLVELLHFPVVVAVYLLQFAMGKHQFVGEIIISHLYIHRFGISCFLHIDFGE
jgi:hypothetical protein